MKEQTNDWERTYERIRSAANDAARSDVKAAGKEIRDSIPSDLRNAKINSDYYVTRISEAYESRSRKTEWLIRMLVASVTLAITLSINYFVVRSSSKGKEQTAQVVQPCVPVTVPPVPIPHSTRAPRKP